MLPRPATARPGCFVGMVLAVASGMAPGAPPPALRAPALPAPPCGMMQGMTIPRRHRPIDFLFLLGVLGLLWFIAGCPKPPPDPDPVSGFTDGPDEPPAVLECPGETQCPCGQRADGPTPGFDPCPGVDLLCGPADACTLSCRTDSDCTSGVSGEACLGGTAAFPGRCAVLCDPEAAAIQCKAAGMPGATCQDVLGVHVCGY